jgi:hypothetical protein
VQNNTTVGGGGGIALAGDAIARFDIRRSSIINNESTDTVANGGGGIFNGHGALFIENSTISGNQARNNGGGVLSTLTTGGFTINASTIANNIAGSAGSGTADGGGLRFESGVSSSLRGNIFVGNRVGGSAGTLNDCSRTGSAGTLATSANLVRSAGTCAFSGVGDVISTDARANPLLVIDGTLPVHVPYVRSPAIDGIPGGCPDNDQLGVARPQDGNNDGSSICDFGAVEIQRLSFGDFEE